MIEAILTKPEQPDLSQYKQEELKRYRKALLENPIWQQKVFLMKSLAINDVKLKLATGTESEQRTALVRADALCEFINAGD